MGHVAARWRTLLAPPGLYLLGGVALVTAAPLESILGEATARFLACVLFNVLLFAWLRVPLPLRPRPLSLAVGAVLGVGIALPGAQGGDPVALTWLGAVVVVVDAAWEELLFRGVAFEVAVRTYGSLGAVVVSSVVFACAHLLDPNAAEPPALLYLACGGVVLGAFRVVTGSLWPAVVLHAAHNLTLSYSTATKDHWATVIPAAVVAIVLLVRMRRGAPPTTATG